MSREGAGLPDLAYAVGLSALRDMTPARLGALLDGRPAQEVYSQLLEGDRLLVERLAPLWGRAGAPSTDIGLDMEPAGDTPNSLPRLTRARSRAEDLLCSWRKEAARTGVGVGWDELKEARVGVVRRGDPKYPSRLLRARQVPELLYLAGRLEHASAPCVGVVGTRRATHYGLEIAAEIGRGLAERGVVVVSGLARGIDAAAHWGGLGATGPSGPPLGVVGGGVDVVYPKENHRLWDEVIATGGIVSEAPIGAAPQSWRFPLRNRIIAALSQVLVVVESSRQGGAMHTVLAADAYGVPVLAVPGSVRSPQSEGTNAIIQEGGAGVALDVNDVLAALSLVCEHDGTQMSFSSSASKGEPPGHVGRSQPLRAGEIGRAAPGRGSKDPLAPAPPDGSRGLGRPTSLCSATELEVLSAIDYTVTLVELACLRTRLELGTVALCLDRLEELGLVRGEGAGWVRT